MNECPDCVWEVEHKVECVRSSIPRYLCKWQTKDVFILFIAMHKSLCKVNATLEKKSVHTDTIAISKCTTVTYIDQYYHVNTQKIIKKLQVD